MTYRDTAELVWRHPLTVGSRIAWWHWGSNMDRLRTQNLSGQTYIQLHSVKSVFSLPILPPLEYRQRHRTQCKALLLSKLLWLWSTYRTFGHFLSQISSNVPLLTEEDLANSPVIPTLPCYLREVPADILTCKFSPRGYILVAVREME